MLCTIVIFCRRCIFLNTFWGVNRNGLLVYYIIKDHFIHKCHFFYDSLISLMLDLNCIYLVIRFSLCLTHTVVIFYDEISPFQNDSSYDFDVKFRPYSQNSYPNSL